MPDLVTARTEYTFGTLSCDDVYDAWLDPAKLRRWMVRLADDMPGSVEVRAVETDPRVGGRFFFSDTRDGEDTEAFGTYLALEKPGLISFTWFVSEEEEAEATSIVRIALTPQGDGCLARVTHEMDAEFEEYLEPTANAWRSMLRCIDETSGGR